MAAVQDELFSTSEGDRWFKRNQQALDRFSAQDDIPLRLLDLYELRPKTVLEIGASNGFRLAAIAHRTGAHCVGVEPSSAAIADGSARYPAISFVQAPASSIPLDGPFELVIVNFVLHWIDRSTLLRSFAELDRMVGDGGYLLLGDFLPAVLTRVPYHHLPEQKVFTYKQNYASAFIETGLYTPVALLTSGHGSETLAADVADRDRTGHWLLRKSSNDNYSTGAVGP